MQTINEFQIGQRVTVRDGTPKPDNAKRARNWSLKNFSGIVESFRGSDGVVIVDLDNSMPGLLTVITEYNPGRDPRTVAPDNSDLSPKAQKNLDALIADAMKKAGAA